jgi:hypothetical protein
VIRSRARLTAGLLIIVSAAAFAIGAASERRTETAEQASRQPPAASNPTSQVLPLSPTYAPTSATNTNSTITQPADTDHGADSDHPTTTPAPGAPTTNAPTTTATLGAVAGPSDTDARQDQDADRGHEPGADTDSAERAEPLFGVNLESTGPVVAAVVVSVLLAAVILTLDTPWLAGAIALAMAGFAALDIREVLHQIGISHPGLAAMATVVALLHVLAATAAAYACPGRKFGRRV